MSLSFIFIYSEWFGIMLIILICEYSEICWLIFCMFCSDSRQVASKPDRQFGSRNKLSNREDEDEDDEPPGGVHAKIKRR